MGIRYRPTIFKFWTVSLTSYIILYEAFLILCILFKTFLRGFLEGTLPTNHVSGLPAWRFMSGPTFLGYWIVSLTSYTILYEASWSLCILFKTFLNLFLSEYFLLLYFYIFIILYYMSTVQYLCILFKLF